MKRKTENLKLKTNKGFTLIELLVVIAIMGILISVSVPNLIGFNRRQQLKNATSEIKSALRFAQSKALASEIEFTPTTCLPGPTDPVTGRPIPATHLKGWYAAFTSGDDSYTISGRCAISWSGAPDYTPLSWMDFGTRSFQLPEGVTFGILSQSPIFILFGPVDNSVTFYANLPNLDSGVNMNLTEFEIPVERPGEDPVSVIVTASGKTK